jgi:hypothetical protein
MHRGEKRGLTVVETFDGPSAEDAVSCNMPVRSSMTAMWQGTKATQSPSKSEHLGSISQVSIMKRI